MKKQFLYLLLILSVVSCQIEETNPTNACVLANLTDASTGKKQMEFVYSEKKLIQKITQFDKSEYEFSYNTKNEVEKIVYKKDPSKTEAIIYTIKYSTVAGFTIDKRNPDESYILFTFGYSNVYKRYTSFNIFTRLNATTSKSQSYSVEGKENNQFEKIYLDLGNGKKELVMNISLYDGKTNKSNDALKMWYATQMIDDWSYFPYLTGENTSTFKIIDPSTKKEKLIERTYTYSPEGYILQANSRITVDGKTVIEKKKYGYKCN